MNLSIEPAKIVKGELTFSGDKSISHRALMFGALSDGVTKITGLSASADCASTISVLRQLGTKIDVDGDKIVVHGRNMKFEKPSQELYAGNSGTTMRLMLGILAGQKFDCVITGDESLSKRPMKRVTVPLRKMGANIEGADDANFAPLKITGGKLSPIQYESPVASAQVKSAIILAGLYADGVTKVTEPFLSRDHTERMLNHFGVNVSKHSLTAMVRGPASLYSVNIAVPGDISSAAFFMALAAIIPGSELMIKNVTLNPTRIGFLDIMEKMGADFSVVMNAPNEGFEPVGDILVRGSSDKMRGVVIEGDDIVRAIDEMPITMVIACFADGQTVIKNAAELRVKETDRINSMVINLRKMGADIREDGDDVIINGPCVLKGAELDSFDDHRTVMSLAVAAAAADGASNIKDSDCVNISFPDFAEVLRSVMSS